MSKSPNFTIYVSKDIVFSVNSKKNKMKSLRIHSYDSRGKNFKTKYSLQKRRDSFNEKPTPLDFDAFIPWFCLELQVPKNVIVRRISQVEYMPYGSRMSKESTSSSKSKSRSIKIRTSSIKSDYTENKTTEVYQSSLPRSSCDINNTIPVTTCYDKRDRLVEIAITGCSFPIHRKVIQAFNVCLPFHLKLSKLSITKGGLDNVVLHEIGKLLPYSNITELCLDDACVPGGSYSELLQQRSKLKYLSLKRCGINDEECERIATTLDLKGNATKTLLLLDLASNKIMDEGARALGETLKNNRHLLYLNLSGNSISDDGAEVILKYLKEFPLTRNDVIDKRRRRFNYLKSRTRVYENCLKEATLARAVGEKEAASLDSEPLRSVSGIYKDRLIRKTKKHSPSFIPKEISVEDDAERMTKEIMGDYEDPFKEEDIKRENNLIYAVGNLTLCSLNLAYNNLSLISIRKILEVLNYQGGVNKTNRSIGLLRIVVDGNNISSRCQELDEIRVCLQKTSLQHEFNMSVFSLTPSSTVSKRRIK